jgi:PKHD-type hydroxylase
MFDYWKWDNAVPDWFCDKIISDIDWDASKKGGVGKDGASVVDENLRRSNVFWVENHSPIGCVAQTYINMANKYANWNFDLTYCEDIQITKYDSVNEGFYDWHLDINNFPNKIRKLSISIILNDSFEGGAFEFRKSGLDVTLKKGSILVFPSYLEHIVAPVNSGVRYSAVTWYSGPHFK